MVILRLQRPYLVRATFFCAMNRVLIYDTQWNCEVRSLVKCGDHILSDRPSPSYLNESAAFSSGLAYVTDDNKVIMKGDDTTWLAAGENRSR